MDVIIFFAAIGVLSALIIGTVCVVANIKESVNFVLYVLNTHIKRKRIVDELFIDVHSKNNKINCIKLENVYFSDVKSHALYPVFYFETGTYIPYAKYYNGDNKPTKKSAVEVITRVLGVKEDELSFGDDGHNVCIYVNRAR